MEQYKKITEEQKKKLDAPLPSEAVTQHPTKTFLSSIKSVYVTERLNDVFGVGSWRIKSDTVERADKGMVVVKVTFSIPEYGIEYECYGGNNNGGEGSKNFDLGDAFKGAVTDALSKIGSWMGIGADVFKGKQKQGVMPKNTQYAPDPIQTAPPVAHPERKPLLMEHLADDAKWKQLMDWVYNAHSLAKDATKFDPVAWIKERRIVADDVAVVFKEKYYIDYGQRQKW